MISNPRNAVVFLALASGALVTAFLARNGEMPAPERSGLGPDQQGYYLIDAVIRESDDDGKFSHRLMAERVEQFDENSEVEFVGLRVEYSPTSDVLWEVYASAARSPADRSFFDLKDDVRLSYASNGGLNAMVFETTELRLYTDDFRAETDRHISIRNLRTGSLTTATGLELDLDTSEMKTSDLISRGTH